MTGVNPRHMIEELQENIKAGDALKAKLVLSHFEEIEREDRNKLIYFLSRADATFSIPLFLHVLNTQDIEPAEIEMIRETMLSILLAWPEKLLQLLSSSDLADKTDLIRLVGELKMEEATSKLLKLIAVSDNEAEVLVIIESLGMIGDPEAINTLTDYLYAANRELISAAVESLGQVGTPTAMHRLAERMGTDSEIDCQILAIFAQVQDQISLDKLNDTIRSHYAHMRTLAKSELVKIGPKAVPVLIENLGDEDADFLIHSLNVLGDIGDESAVGPIRKLLMNEPKSGNVRFAAYEALALLPLKKGAYTLTAGLSDSEDNVCVAAARAIDKNFSKILGAGIKNLLHGNEDEAKQIVKTIVDAQTDNIFSYLLGDEVFEKLILTALKKSHRDTRKHYAWLLQQAGRKDLAGKIVAVEEGGRPKVVAVDDSRMILGIYRATLHELGFEPVLFEFPASAINWLEKERPFLVLTDLNMPAITGIELTAELRKKYSKDELPILMVTTQNESQDNEAAYEAGVNTIVHKPFTSQSLGKAIEQVAPL